MISATYLGPEVELTGFELLRRPLILFFLGGDFILCCTLKSLGKLALKTEIFELPKNQTFYVLGALFRTAYEKGSEKY